jgi:hypothetical protein
MIRRLFLLAGALFGCGLLVASESSECATISVKGNQGTISADTIRPLDSIALTLLQAYGITVSAEEPEYQFAGDLQDISQADPEWSAQHLGAHYNVPKRRRLQIDFPALPNGTPQDISKLLHAVVRNANDQMPFGFRLDVDDEFYVFVPTRTHDAKGTSVAVLPLLDRRVTIPAGDRSIAETARLMTDALSAQTGLHVSCCQSIVAGIPWGMAVVSFEAHDEPARNVLERLIRLSQTTSTVSSRYSWVLRCESVWCFINLEQAWYGECRDALHLQSVKR